MYTNSVCDGGCFTRSGMTYTFFARIMSNGKSHHVFLVFRSRSQLIVTKYALNFTQCLSIWPIYVVLDMMSLFECPFPIDLSNAHNSTVQHGLAAFFYLHSNSFSLHIKWILCKYNGNMIDCQFGNYLAVVIASKQIQWNQIRM